MMMMIPHLCGNDSKASSITIRTPDPGGPFSSRLLGWLVLHILNPSWLPSLVIVLLLADLRRETGMLSHDDERLVAIVTLNCT